MAFVKCYSGRKSNGRSTRKVGELSLVTLSVVQGGARNRNGLDRKAALNFRIHREIVKKMRWLAGDRVDIFFDDCDPFLILVKRSQDGEFALSPNGGKKFMGKSDVNCSLKFTAPDDLPFCLGDRLYAANIQEDNGSLLLQFEPVKKDEPRAV